jgi:hypothetical protein
MVVRPVPEIIEFPPLPPLLYTPPGADPPPPAVPTVIVYTVDSNRVNVPVNTPPPPPPPPAPAPPPPPPATDRYSIKPIGANGVEYEPLVVNVIIVLDPLVVTVGLPVTRPE